MDHVGFLNFCPPPSPALVYMRYTPIFSLFLNFQLILNLLIYTHICILSYTDIPTKVGMFPSLHSLFWQCCSCKFFTFSVDIFLPIFCPPTRDLISHLLILIYIFFHITLEWEVSTLPLIFSEKNLIRIINKFQNQIYTLSLSLIGDAILLSTKIILEA